MLWFSVNQWPVVCDFSQGHHKHERYHRGTGGLQRVFPGVLQHRLSRCIRKQAESPQIKPQNQMHCLREADRGQSGLKKSYFNV